MNFIKTNQCDIGLSDLTFTVLKGNTISKTTCRSFKGLENDAFIQDLQRIPFHVPHILKDINDFYWAHDKMFKEVVDELIPMKQRNKRKHSAPFMKSDLRKAVNHKSTP